MTTKTKTPVAGIVATLIVAGIALALIGKLPVRPRTDPDAPRQVSLTAIWNPSPRTEGVALRVTIGGVPTEDLVANTAPFTRGYAVPKGTRVEIYARLQGDHRAELGCSIAVNGVQLVTEHKPKAGPADPVACWLNV